MFSCCIITKEKHGLFSTSKHDDVITSKNEFQREGTKKVDFYGETPLTSALDIQENQFLEKTFNRGIFNKNLTNGRKPEDIPNNKSAHFGGNTTNRPFNTRLTEDLASVYKVTRERTYSGGNLTNRTLSLDDTVTSKNSYEVRSPLHGDVGWFGGFDSYIDMMGRLEDAHFFVALMDYDPGQHRKDDIRLTKGDLVQLISSDSGWLFVLLLKDDFDKQGWVPDTYLERKLDIDVGSIAAHTERGGSPKPKPRPRPAPRPRTKPQETPPTDLPKRPAPPKPDERDALPPSPPPVPAQQPYEEDLYDEPEMTLRSVYDAEPWYFGNISRADCERQLSTYGRQQEFLIRDSQRAKGSYALSVKYCYRIRHFPIEAVDGGKLLIGKLSFNNLMDIVIYYQKNPLFYSEHKEPISLGSAFVKDRTGQKK
uniref:Uncharacterized protein n=1 Tax=Clytia hemisphaerica TaxID=252671 RepID=A0A7M5WKG4_9CNID